MREVLCQSLLDGDITLKKIIESTKRVYLDKFALQISLPSDIPINQIKVAELRRLILAHISNSSSCLTRNQEEKQQLVVSSGPQQQDTLTVSMERAFQIPSKYSKDSQSTALLVLKEFETTMYKAPHLLHQLYFVKCHVTVKDTKSGAARTATTSMEAQEILQELLQAGYTYRQTFITGKQCEVMDQYFIGSVGNVFFHGSPYGHYMMKFILQCEPHCTGKYFISECLIEFGHRHLELDHE